MEGGRGIEAFHKLARNKVKSVYFCLRGKLFSQQTV